MQIGTQNERYFVIQIDLHEPDGTEEARELIELLLTREFSEEGGNHLAQCLKFIQMLHNMKQHPN